MNSRLKELFFIIIIIGILFILAVSGLYDCPLDFIVGIPCPLCGITRAFISVCRGDFSSAFYYHPLWPVIMIWLILFLLHFLGFISLPKKLIDAAGWVLVFLLISCYVIRHINGSPVVQIHFETSLIYRVFRMMPFSQGFSI